MPLVGIHRWQIRSERAELRRGREGGRETRREGKRGHWLEMLPICQRLTAFAAGINSNKVELAAVLTSHTHTHTHAHAHTVAHNSPPEEQVNSLSSSQGPPLAYHRLCLPPLHVKPPLPLPVLSSVKLSSFHPPLLTQVANTMRTLATRKESHSTGWRDCGRASVWVREREWERESERERETLYLNGW